MKAKRKATNVKQSLLFASASIIGLGFLVGGVFNSEAALTDTQTANPNTITSSVVTLGTTPTTALISLTNMSPGDAAYGEITMRNDGRADLRYAATQSVTNADGKNMASVLSVHVRTGLSACNATQWSGTNTTDGPYIATSVPLTSTTLFGSVATGAQAGDRSLVAGASEKLCFRAQMPLSVTNEFQKAATTATYVFTSEQVKNNP